MIRRAFFPLVFSSLLAACSSVPPPTETLQATQIGEIRCDDTKDRLYSAPRQFLRWLPDESGLIFCPSSNAVCAKRLDGTTIWRHVISEGEIRSIAGIDKGLILESNVSMQTALITSLSCDGKVLKKTSAKEFLSPEHASLYLMSLEEHGVDAEGRFLVRDMNHNQYRRYGLNAGLQTATKKEFLVHGNGALQVFPENGKPNWELLIPQEAAERVENPKENERISVIGPQKVEQYIWDGSDRIFYSIGGGCWAGDDGVLHLYSRHQNREIWAIKTSMYRQVFAVDFAHQRLALGGKSGKGALLRHHDFDGHILGEVRLSAEQEPQSIALSPSGRRIAFFGWDHKLYVYEMKR